MDQSYWCIAFIDGMEQRVKVEYVKRGKFKVIQDLLGDNIDKIIDASDIIKLE